MSRSSSFVCHARSSSATHTDGSNCAPDTDRPVGGRADLERQQGSASVRGSGAPRSARRGCTSSWSRLRSAAKCDRIAVGRKWRHHGFEDLDQVEQRDRVERVVGQIEERQRRAEMTRRLLGRGHAVAPRRARRRRDRASTLHGVAAHEDLHRGAGRPSARDRAARAERFVVRVRGDDEQPRVRSRRGSRSSVRRFASRRRREHRPELLGDRVDVEVRLGRGACVRAEAGAQRGVVVQPLRRHSASRRRRRVRRRVRSPRPR